MSSPADSVPSLGAVSTVSSETENDEGLCRRLFESPDMEKQSKWETIITDIAASNVKPHIPVVYESHEEDSDTSTLISSKATQENTEKQNVSKVDRANTPDDSPQGNVRAREPSQAKTTVKQLISKFSMFEAPAPTPPSSRKEGGRAVTVNSQNEKNWTTNDELNLLPELCTRDTTDTSEIERWKKRAEALDRECTALKDIVCNDSVSLTKLKSENDTLQEANSHHISEIMLLNQTLKSTAEKMQSIEREKEEQDDREIARLETIRVLKEEVDRLTKARRKEIQTRTPQTLDAMSQEQLAEMQFEHELFAAQIIRDEHNLKEAKQSLEQKCTQIRDLDKRVEVMRARLVKMEPFELEVKALETEKHMMSIEHEEQMKQKERQLAIVTEQLEEATRVETAATSDTLDGCRRTEMHLVETEQDLETALQLLKEQEDQILELEERIVHLTSSSDTTAQELVAKVPKEERNPCPIVWWTE